MSNHFGNRGTNEDDEMSLDEEAAAVSDDDSMDDTPINDIDDEVLGRFE